MAFLTLLFVVVQRPHALQRRNAVMPTFHVSTKKKKTCFKFTMSVISCMYNFFSLRTGSHRRHSPDPCIANGKWGLYRSLLIWEEDVNPHMGWDLVSIPHLQELFLFSLVEGGPKTTGRCIGERPWTISGMGYEKWWDGVELQAVGPASRSRRQHKEAQRNFPPPDLGGRRCHTADPYGRGACWNLTDQNSPLLQQPSC